MLLSSRHLGFGLRVGPRKSLASSAEMSKPRDHSRQTEDIVKSLVVLSGSAMAIMIALGLGTGCSVEQGDQGAIGPSPTEATVILEVPSVTTEFCSFTPLQDTTTVTTDPELMQEILTLRVCQEITD